jgi:hypothetical protein
MKFSPETFTPAPKRPTETADISPLIANQVEAILPNTYIEQKFTGKVGEVIRNGFENPAAYESYRVTETRFTPEKKLWLSFPGLGDGRKTFDIDKIDAHSMTPRQGVSIIFNGPAGIAGTSPTQCMETTDRVFETVKEYAKKYPDHEINVFGFSAGTHLAHYVTNQLGELYGEQKVNRLISVASGMSIGMGIFSTEVVRDLSEHLTNQGWDKHRYSEAIAGYRQQDNTTWLPSGDNLQLWYGGWDRFIPEKMEGGTEDLIDHLKEAGKNPKAVRLQFADHITIVAYLAVMQKLGHDVYGLGEKPPVNWLESDYKEAYLDIVRSRLDALPQEELYTLARYIVPATKDGSVEFEWGVRTALEGRRIGTQSLSSAEKIVADILTERGILKVQVTGRNIDFYALSPEAYAYWNANRITHAVRQFWADESTNITQPQIKQIAELTEVEYLPLSETLYKPAK